MDEIVTYRDYIDTLHARTSDDENEKREAEQRLARFKESKPDLYEEYRAEKIRRRQERNSGAEEDVNQPVKITDENEEIVNKVAGTLRLIDEMKRCGLEIPQEEIDEVKQLHGDKEIRKVLRQSGNRALLYLLEHRKKSFSKRFDTSVTGELHYFNVMKAFGIQWVPLFEFAMDAPEMDNIKVDPNGAEAYCTGPAKELLEEDRKLIDETRQVLDIIDKMEKEEVGNKKEYNSLLDSVHKYKGSAKRLKKNDYYLYLLQMWRRKSLDHPQYKGVYERLRKTTVAQWREYLRQTLESVSVLKIIGVNVDEFSIEAFSEEELAEIMTSIDDNAIIRMIGDNGRIDRDKLFEKAVMTVKKIRINHLL